MAMGIEINRFKTFCCLIPRLSEYEQIKQNQKYTKKDSEENSRLDQNSLISFVLEKCEKALAKDQITIKNKKILNSRGTLDLREEYIAINIAMKALNSEAIPTKLLIYIHFFHLSPHALHSQKPVSVAFKIAILS